MLKQLDQLKSLFGVQSWRRQTRAWFIGSLAAVFEMASLAAILPLSTVILGQNEALKIGDFEIPPAATISLISLVYLLGLFTRMMATRVTAKVTLEEGYRYSAEQFESALRQNYSWHQRIHSSEIRAMLLSDAQDLMSNATIPLGRLLAQAALATGIAIVVLVVNPSATLVVILLLAAVYSTIFLVLGPIIRRNAESQLKFHRQRHRDSTDALAAMRELKLNQLEGPFSKSFSEASMGIANVGKERALYTEIPRLFLEAILFLVLISSVIALSTFVDEELANQLPTLTLIAVAALKLFPTGHQIYANFASLRAAPPVLERLVKFQETMVAKPPEFDAPHLEMSLRLNNITFGHHDSSKPVIENLSLDVAIGQSVAITGPSGAGKSTLVDLIAGLLEPQLGNIEIDGRELESSQLASWQRQIRYCPQNPTLFDSSIEENIAIGDSLDLLRVKRAAELAAISDLVGGKELKRSAGEQGSGLSGGQVKRVGLARAFYRSARVYILDEPTSGLDEGISKEVMSNVFENSKDAILVIVTHDKNLAAKCEPKSPST